MINNTVKAIRTILSRQFISALLILSFVLPGTYALLPEKAEAGFSNCAVKFLSFFGVNTTKELAPLPAAVPVHQLGQVLSSTSQSSQAQSNFLKDCIEHGLALALGKMILAAITQSIVNWINSGFNGSPSFVTNPGQFFTDIADRVAGEFILGSDLAFLCSPFKLQIQLALAVNYGSGTGGNGPAACTLSGVIDNIDGFFDDFSQGGWGGWFSMTQSANNNPYGAYLNAESALSVKIAGQRDIELMKLNWGNGFMSFEECEDGTIVMGGSAQQEEGGVVIREGQSARGGDHGNCEVKTPGKLIEGTLQKTTDLPLEQLGVADDLDKIFNALGFQLIKQIMGGIGGLMGASKSSGGGGGSSSIVDRLADQARTRAETEQSTSDTSRSQTDGLNNSGDGTADGSTYYPVSTGKQVRQSSYGENPSRALVDGDTTNAFDNKYLGGLTDFQTNPWMQIDLSKPTPISKITIYQRGNPSDASRSYPRITFSVLVLNKDEVKVWESRRYTQDFSRAPIDIDVPAGIEGRYIKIQGYSDYESRLEIAEVEVYKTNAPVITLRGDSVMNINIGQSFTDPGYTATDDEDDAIASKVTVTGTVDTSRAGVYTLKYNVTNADGVAAKEVTRTVIVQQAAY